MELTVADLQVLLAMNKIWEEKGEGKVIEVSFYEIAKKLNRALSRFTLKNGFSSMKKNVLQQPPNTFFILQTTNLSSVYRIKLDFRSLATYVSYLEI